MSATATISPCGRYRYNLTRQWDDTRRLLTFVMLNPSTADANVDDPTIRRCMGFAHREGFGGVRVVNLSAFRATNPKDVPVTFTIGDKLALRDALAEATGDPVVCAWGAGGIAFKEALWCVQISAAALNADLRCLGKTKDGHPRHPLYVKADQPLEVWP